MKRYNKAEVTELKTNKDFPSDGGAPTNHSRHSSGANADNSEPEPEHPPPRAPDEQGVASIPLPGMAENGPAAGPASASAAMYRFPQYYYPQARGVPQQYPPMQNLAVPSSTTPHQTPQVSNSAPQSSSQPAEAPAPLYHATPPVKSETSPVHSETNSEGGGRPKLTVQIPTDQQKRKDQWPVGLTPQQQQQQQQWPGQFGQSPIGPYAMYAPPTAGPATAAEQQRFQQFLQMSGEQTPGARYANDSPTGYMTSDWGLSWSAHPNSQFVRAMVPAQGQQQGMQPIPGSFYNGGIPGSGLGPGVQGSPAQFTPSDGRKHPDVQSAAKKARY